MSRHRYLSNILTICWYIGTWVVDVHHPCLAIHDAAVGAESERHDRAQRDDVHDWPAFTIEIKETLVGFHSGCTGGGWQQQAAAKDEEEVE